MSINKEAGQAVNMLIEQGVDYDTAVELVMEKKAGTGLNIALLGTENANRISAVKHGKPQPTPNGWATQKKNDAKAGLSAMGRGVVTGAATGLAMSAGSKALAARAIRRGATTVARGSTFVKGMTGGAALAGYIGGQMKSYHNQGKAMDAKHQEKKATFNAAIEAGYDFDAAVALVSNVD